MYKIIWFENVKILYFHFIGFDLKRGCFDAVLTKTMPKFLILRDHEFFQSKNISTFEVLLV